MCRIYPTDRSAYQGGDAGGLSERRGPVWVSVRQGSAPGPARPGAFSFPGRLGTLEPGAQAEHETGAVHALAGRAGDIGRAAETAVPGDADIRRELAFDLVAQAKPQ